MIFPFLNSRFNRRVVLSASLHRPLVEEAVELPEVVRLDQILLQKLLFVRHRAPVIRLRKAARKFGLTNVTDGDDGACTILMTAEEQAAVCAALRESLDEQLLALPESGTWPFLDGAALSADGTAVTLHSDAARYSPARDNAVAQAVYIPALLCAVFAGDDADTFALHFTVLDSDGRTVLGEFDYPEQQASPSPDAAESAAPEADGE